MKKPRHGRWKVMLRSASPPATPTTSAATSPGTTEPVRRYEALMKHGWPPLGPKYWTAWNFPIVTQHSPSSAALVKDLDHRLALLPAEVRSVIERLLRARATTYAHDPRTARFIVENDGRGGLTVKAETRLLPGVTPE